MKKSVYLCFFTGIAAALIQANAAIIAEDTFTVGGSRTDGSQVVGTATEGGIGGLSWQGSTDVKFEDSAGGGGYARTDSSTNQGLGLAFEFATYAANGSVATVSADLYLRNENDGSPAPTWMGVGFAGSTPGLNSGGGAVWVKVRTDPDGQTPSWELWSNTTASIQASGNIPGTILNDTTPVSLSFAYDNASEIVTDISLNGTSVLTNFDVGATGTVGTISHLNFFSQNPRATNPGGYLDNVSLSVIPEPSTIGLLMLGLLPVAITALRRRRS